MINLYTVIGLMLAYLIGSVPTAVWIGKVFYNTDIREYGSGNAGATNTFRVLGKRAGSIVMVLDSLKGFLATNVAFLLNAYNPDSIQFLNFQIALGVIAVIGHIFPVFADFKGGKGVATLLGMGLALHPLATLICVGVFLVVLIISKYVSLGSILASITFPVLLFVVFSNSESSLRLFSIAIALLVITTHQKNIERIFKGNESKSYLFGRNKNS